MRSTVDLARAIRRHSLRMACHSHASHIGSSLSIADLLAVLYGRVLRVDPARPNWVERDRFVLSKGHAATAAYAVLAECGFFPLEHLDAYSADGSVFCGHVTAGVPGIEISTGSLGHGLPVACGMALCAKRERLPFRVFVLLSDGECDEGSTWEAALFAPHHHLDNLTVILDYNKLQGFGTVQDILDLEPLLAKWAAFRWAVREIDGHDHRQTDGVLASTPFEPEKPSLVVAHTVKGKGVSFMENQIAWHYRSPNLDQLASALSELESAR
jgi:transketolase